MIQGKVRGVKGGENKVLYVKLALILVGVLMASTLLKGALALRSAFGRVDDARSQLAKAEEESKVLQDKWSDVQTRDFIERMARDKLNMQLPQETVVLLPRQPQEKKESVSPVSRKQNWEKWWDLIK